MIHNKNVKEKHRRRKALWPPRFFLHFFIISLWFVANLPQACSVSSNSAKNKNKPNIVFLLIDALRPDKLGCYGFQGGISPEIDEMARKGVEFKSVLSQCSWTIPSVGSFLTSLYPRTLGLYRKTNEILNDRFTTLPEILKSQNYLTIGITANPNLNKVYNFHQGFDRYVDSDIVWPWMGSKPSETIITSTTRLKSNLELFETAMAILEKDKHRPFFLYLQLMDVHRLKTEIKPEFLSMFHQYSKEQERMYYLKVRQTSYDVGNFVQRVLSKPGCENTLFIISADHGEGLFDHPDVPNSELHGYYLYESQVKVPLIFYHPNGGLKPRLIEQEVRLIDLLPTLLDYLKISRRPSDIVGKSLLPLIEGTKTKISLPKYFVVETRTNNYYKIAVYGKNWIYIENRANDPGVNPRELQRRYRKQNGKLTDLITKEPEIAGAMKEFLKKWESKFPDGKVTPWKEKPSPEAIEQLKSLGYIK